MLSVEEFREKLTLSNQAGWLRVAVDVDNKDQFYIVGNGGMGNTMSFPIERCLPEIKQCVVSMMSSGELIQDEKTNLSCSSRENFGEYWDSLVLVILSNSPAKYFLMRRGNAQFLFYVYVVDNNTYQDDLFGNPLGLSKVV